MNEIPPSREQVTYDFKEKLREGICHEQILDKYFSNFYTIEPVPHAFQTLGIDRIFTAKFNGTRWSVEYKADSTAGRTGNCFIETVSVDTTKKAGWAFTMMAQLLVYYVPPMGKAYIVSTAKLKWKLPDWIRRYETRAISNHGYFAYGVLVPLSELSAIAHGILIIEESKNV